MDIIHIEDIEYIFKFISLRDLLNFGYSNKYYYDITTNYLKSYLNNKRKVYKVLLNFSKKELFKYIDYLNSKTLDFGVIESNNHRIVYEDNPINYETIEIILKSKNIIFYNNCNRIIIDETIDGSKSELWIKNKKIHNVNNPSRKIWFNNGNIKLIEWYYDNCLHNDNGPALIKYNRNGMLKEKTWYKYNYIHRNKVPARIRYYKDYILYEYYQNGVKFLEKIINND